MKLYMVHVGYYDKSIGEGIYETHLNYFVAANNAKDAKTKTHQLSEFKERSMHIDGMKEISSVDGYRILLEKDVDSESGKVISYDETKEL